jgi:putative peptidoglycan lipid II flippase
MLAFWLVLTCRRRRGGRAGAGVGHRLGPEEAFIRPAVVMTRWMFPYIAFMSMVALSAGILNTWKRFAVPAVTPVLLNLSVIAAAAWWGQAAGAPVGPVSGAGGWGDARRNVLQLAVQMAGAAAPSACCRASDWLGRRIRGAWRTRCASRAAAHGAGAAGRVGGADLAAHQHPDRQRTWRWARCPG